jgi:hypothetical protein
MDPYWIGLPFGSKIEWNGCNNGSLMVLQPGPTFYPENMYLSVFPGDIHARWQSATRLGAGERVEISIHESLCPSGMWNTINVKNDV